MLEGHTQPKTAAHTRQRGGQRRTYDTDVICQERPGAETSQSAEQASAQCQHNISASNYICQHNTIKRWHRRIKLLFTQLQFIAGNEQ